MQQKIASPTSAAVNNPFLSSPTSSGNIVDLFGSAPANAAQAASTKASDDLLQLGNPFADMFGGSAAAAPQPAANNMWMNNGMFLIGNNYRRDFHMVFDIFLGFNGTTGAPAGNNTFVSDSNFSSVFGATEPVGKHYVQ